MKYTQIFGMNVNDISLEAAVADAVQASREPASLVVTPNLDHLQRFRENADFRNLYSSARLVLADGMPIVWLARIMNGVKLERVTGIDFFRACIVAAEKQGIDIAIIGGTRDVLDLASENLRSAYPRLTEILTLSPSSQDLESLTYISELRKSLSSPRPRMVALCLGSPKQEHIFENVFRDSGITGLFVGAGATVDFLAGSKKRSPLLLQKLGLEWLFRLVHEPKRLFKRYAKNAGTFLRLIVLAVIFRIKNKRI